MVNADTIPTAVARPVTVELDPVVYPRLTLTLKKSAGMSDQLTQSLILRFDLQEIGPIELVLHH